MGQPLPPEAWIVWRNAGLNDLALRGLQATDLDTVADVIRRGEGYTLASLPTLQSVRSDLEGFGGDADKRGFIAIAAGGSVAAFLLFFERDRSRNRFEGDLIGRLPARLFPIDGRFLQVYELWVVPARGRGVATALKRVLEAIAQAEGVGMLYTVTEVVHATARRLNARLGYSEVYRGPMWDDVERVALVKRL